MDNRYWFKNKGFIVRPTTKIYLINLCAIHGYTAGGLKTHHTPNYQWLKGWLISKEGKITNLKSLLDEKSKQI